MQIDSDKPKPSSFWQREFFGPPPSEIVFDFLCGILLPIICMTFDPGIFHPTCYGPGALAAYANYFYTAVWIEMIVLMLWVIFYTKIKYGLEVIAGMFFLGIPLALIPIISLIPTGSSLTIWLLCLGVGEFFPLLIAFVYLWNGIHALRRAQLLNPTYPVRQWLVVLASMLIFVLAVPAFVRWQTPGLFSAHVESSVPSSVLCSNANE